MSSKVELLKAIAVTAELCGRVLSPEAAAVFVDDLSGYPDAHVVGALRRCRKEVRGVLTVQDVVSRLDDGRPTAAEAWASLTFNERDSTVWTDEAAQAFGIVADIHENGDRVGARLAFIAAYDRLVAEARDQRCPVNWTPSLGSDPAGREAALAQAARLGRIGKEQLALASPDVPASPHVLQLIAHATQRAA